MLVTFSSQILCIIYHYWFCNPCYKFNDVLKKSLEFEIIQTIWKKIVHMVQASNHKYVKKSFFSYFVDCKSWLNWLMDDHHLGYSANLKQNSNMFSISRVLCHMYNPTIYERLLVCFVMFKFL
jgi:hypothetical protein